MKTKTTVKAGAGFLRGGIPGGLGGLRGGLFGALAE